MAKNSKPISSEPSRQLTTIENRRLHTLEEVIDQHVEGFIKTGEALAEIKDKGLYFLRAETFEEYIRVCWPNKLSRQQAYKLMSATAAMKSIEGLEISHPPNDGLRVASCDTQNPKRGGVVGKDISLDQGAAIELSKLETDQKKADAVNRAAAFSKSTDSGIVITKSAMSKAIKAMSDDGEVSEPKKPPPPTSKESAKDQRGHPIPKSLEFIFDAVTELKTQAKNIAAVINWLEKTKDHPAMQQVPNHQMRVDLENAKEALKYSIPYAVCPTCKGKGCTRKVQSKTYCEGRGWLIKSQSDGILEDAWK